MVDSITLPDLNAFLPALRRSLFLEAFASGNLTLVEAKASVHTLLEALGSVPLEPHEYQLRQLVQLPLNSGGHYRRIATFNQDDDNSAVENLYQVGPDETRLNSLLELFVQVTSNECYDTLRTQQQLGYLVWSGARSDFGISAYRVLVQSPTHPPHELDQRIEAWLGSMADYIKGLTPAEYAAYREGVIGRKLEKDKSLKCVEAIHRILFDPP